MILRAKFWAEAVTGVASNYIKILAAYVPEAAVAGGVGAAQWAAHNASAISWGGAVPNVPIQKQLEGKGQLKDFRQSPNLEGEDIDSLLKKTPAELEEMAKKGEITAKTLKQIKKAFEGRDLGGRKGG